MATLSVEKSHCSQYHMISYDIISYHSEVLRSKYGSPVGLIDLMLKVPGSIMFHKKFLQAAPMAKWRMNRPGH